MRMKCVIYGWMGYKRSRSDCRKPLACMHAIIIYNIWTSWGRWIFSSLSISPLFIYCLELPGLALPCLSQPRSTIRPQPVQCMPSMIQPSVSKSKRKISRSGTYADPVPGPSKQGKSYNFQDHTNPNQHSQILAEVNCAAGSISIVCAVVVVVMDNVNVREGKGIMYGIMIMRNVSTV